MLFLILPFGFNVLDGYKVKRDFGVNWEGGAIDAVFGPVRAQKDATALWAGWCIHGTIHSPDETVQLSVSTSMF